MFSNKLANYNKKYPSVTENKTNFGKENHHRFPRHHLEFVDHFHIVDIGDILNQFENISSEQFAQKPEILVPFQPWLVWLPLCQV